MSIQSNDCLCSGIDEKRAIALSMTTALADKRRDISASVDAAAKLDAKVTSIMRDKRDMWRAIEVSVLNYGKGVKTCGSIRFSNGRKLQIHLLVMN